MESSSVAFQLVVNFGVVLFGLALGSFLNVVIYRLMHGGSVALGRSACPHCKKTLAPADLIPLASFVALGGRCRSCKKPISWQYPLVEFLTAVLTLVLWNAYGLTLEWALAVALLAFLIVTFTIDLRYRVILDGVVFPAMIVATLLSLVQGRTAESLLLGAGIGFAFFFLQYAISKGRWIGGGDIRLGVLIGLALGWKGALLALVLAYLSGSVIAITLVATKKRAWKDPIPFGTFLTAATVTALLAGDQIIAWYLKLPLLF